MHDVLPSYSEAIARPDWLQLAAPYVAIADYPALCRVNSRCWRIFAPLLWRDPCAWSKRLGRSTDDDTGPFWSRFLLQDAQLLSPKTRDLIRVVDVRKAVTGNDHNLWAVIYRKRFYELLPLLPNVESLLIDDYCRMNARCLEYSDPSRPDRRLLMLSLKNTGHGISRSLTESRHLRALIYLDISGPAPVDFASLDERWLPNLRILKMCRKQLSTYRWETWAGILNWRLWSLDISDNELTDQSVLNMTGMIDDYVLRTTDHFASEGMLERWDQRGALDQYILRESPLSHVFLPGPRYLIDAPPINNLDGADDPDVFWPRVRSDGSTPVRPDTLEGVLGLLSRPGVSNATEHLPGSRGITHLHISGNKFTAAGIQELLINSEGHFELFDCERMLFFPPKRWRSFLNPPKLKAPRLFVSSAVRMSGLPGLGHLFRPVYSSNLRVLRIHHSLVTNIPTLTMDGLRSIECVYLAENGVFPHLQQAYMLPFLPDMNPRLQSLTLTCVPRHSFGPLICRLAFFFRMVSLQEEALSILTKGVQAQGGRPLRLVSGLKHVALELEPRTAEEPLDFDAEKLMASGEAPFSFFDSPLTETSKTKPKKPRIIDIWRETPDPSEAPPVKLVRHDTPEGHNTMSPHQPSSSDPERQTWLLYSNVTTTVSGVTHTSNSVVWAGNSWSTNPVIRKYNYLVVNYRMQEGVGPATMHQTRAGAPVGCLLFHTAWLFAATPQSLELPPNVDALKKLDVAAEVRQRWCRTPEDYQRAKERFPIDQLFIWGGKLEIVEPEPVDNGWLLWKPHNEYEPPYDYEGE
ncbi:hypothetical protein BBK36DRAFT_1180252 [Trichoderma citrinoviride]|uniref:Uncharacterized protein n=1 Tax=Trichoderma citrinoviride TaxID=58853 RepID=A0A2T4B342_9HYPO|nr:hypothetical protein BBK36DRAFT_1180252 [Trichoderma citrinoviride]PTB63745.1 hypothetical protein BBK36DRAFT_1180252 [Trichoderma citrinoviride]